MDKSKQIQKLVPIQYKLKQEKKFEDITQLIIQEIEDIPDYKTRKKDCEFILHICNIVEYLVKKKYNLDKEEIVIHIAELIFEDFSDEDKKFISDTILFLLDHGQIKPVKMLSKAGVFCCDYINRKLL